ncbi:ABC transporter substrate-binding protein [Bacillus sp. 03113]|uniref:ABC transporter substrate-binding protein n=1 Tax=Bacillus sp. 03113 TaxID=2578211 RepID=UPI001144E23D|nr:extracellular solute-binding protein [Bacillus sp. 03113]
MKKKVSVLAIIGMALMLIVGCSNSSNGSEKKTVKFFNGKVESVDYMNELIDQFNKQNSQYKVVQEFQKDASSAMQTKLASGDVPDLTNTDVTQEYIDAGKFEDLSKEDIWNHINPNIKQLVTDIKSGKQYKIATNETMAGIFYNKDLAPEGIAFDTWDHFITSLESLQAANEGKDALYLGGKDSWTLGHLMEFWGHGIVKEQYSVLEAKKLFINNDQSVLNFASSDGPIYTFAERLAELKEKGLINQNAITASYDEQIEKFAKGEAIAIPQGFWAMSAILQKNKEMNIGFMPFPSMKDGEKPLLLVAEDSTYAIPSQAKNKEGAKAFLKFILKEENLKGYSEFMKSPSAFENIDSNWSDKKSEFENAKKESVNIGFTSFPSGFSGDDSGRYVQAFLSGQYKTAQDFTEAYSEAWNKSKK